MAAASLSDVERKDIRDAFKILDVDGDGKLSKPELETLLRGQFVVACDKDLVDLMAKMDMDSSGSVDYEEFEEFVAKNNLTKYNPEEASEEMLDAFQVFDKDNDGFIDLEEFRAVLTSIGDKMTDEELKVLMQDADVNGDGKIDYKEFCTFMASGIF
ncbi:neo-calmodulin-like isoform X2 [Babylonia areolata]|uniref:neo-calmodulin-like isoform X2 n=1 Tax=Babylonia areolata TaxID=304850 RepID=UPI003FD05921